MANEKLYIHETIRISVQHRKEYLDHFCNWGSITREPYDMRCLGSGPPWAARKPGSGSTPRRRHDVGRVSAHYGNLMTPRTCPVVVRGMPRWLVPRGRTASAEPLESWPTAAHHEG